MSVDELAIVQEQIRKMPSYTFKNKHGEEFKVYCNGKMAFLGGDEVRAMVQDKHKLAKHIILLFNPHFSVWSQDELYKLGQALMVLNAPPKKGTN